MEFTQAKRNATFAVCERIAAHSIHTHTYGAYGARNRMPYQLLDLCLFEVKFRIYLRNNRRGCVALCMLCIVIANFRADIDARTLTACVSHTHIYEMVQFGSFFHFN